MSAIETHHPASEIYRRAVYHYRGIGAFTVEMPLTKCSHFPLRSATI